MGIGLGIAITCSLAAAAGSPPVTIAMGDRPGRPVTLPHLPNSRSLDFRLTVADPSAMPVVAGFEPDDAAATAPERWTADLVAIDRRLGLPGARIRHSRMTAGVSLRLTNADGTLAPVVAMAGPAGRMLTRLVLQAADF